MHEVLGVNSTLFESKASPPAINTLPFNIKVAHKEPEKDFP